jgi:hypothetical protein
MSGELSSVVQSEWRLPRDADGIVPTGLPIQVERVVPNALLNLARLCRAILQHLKK